MSRSRLRQPHAEPTPSASPRPANIISFPPGLHRRTVAELVEAFLAIPPSPERPAIFRRTALARLERRRLALGLPPEIVEAELLDIEDAIATRLTAMFSDDCGDVA